jgi:hypothetical protein
MKGPIVFTVAALTRVGVSMPVKKAGLILIRHYGAMQLQGVPTVKTKRAAIYVRVSTNDQETGLQETELQEYVESRGWSYTVYRDQGQSGAKMKGQH